MVWDPKKQRDDDCEMHEYIMADGYCTCWDEERKYLETNTKLVCTFDKDTDKEIVIVIDPSICQGIEVLRKEVVFRIPINSNECFCVEVNGQDENGEPYNKKFTIKAVRDQLPTVKPVGSKREF